MNIHWKDWCWHGNSNTLATWCKELTHWKRPWCWERLKAGGERNDRGRDGWMASLTQWTWVWVSSRSWWWTSKPGMLHIVHGVAKYQTRLSDWLNWIEPPWIKSAPSYLDIFFFWSGCSLKKRMTTRKWKWQVCFHRGKGRFCVTCNQDHQWGIRKLNLQETSREIHVIQCFLKVLWNVEYLSSVASIKYSDTDNGYLELGGE